MDFAVSADHVIKIKENEKIDKYENLTGELNKKKNSEGDGDSNCSWYARNDYPRVEKGVRIAGNQRKNQDHSNHSIIKIGQNTEKNPRNLRRLAVIQTLKKDKQQTLV